MELFPCRIRRRLSKGLKRKPMALIKRLRQAKKEAGPLEKPEVNHESETVNIDIFYILSKAVFGCCDLIYPGIRRKKGLETRIFFCLGTQGYNLRKKYMNLFATNLMCHTRIDHLGCNLNQIGISCQEGATNKHLPVVYTIT